MPETNETTEARETITLFYLGFRHGVKDNTLYQSVVEVDPETNNGDRFCWGSSQEKWYQVKGNKSLFPSYATAGSLWVAEVEREDGRTSLFNRTIRPVGLWSNQGQRSELQTLSRAIRQEFEAQSDARQKVSKRDDLAALDPIREAYLMATPTQRPFILANAISYITRGSTTKISG